MLTRYARVLTRIVPLWYSTPLQQGRVLSNYRTFTVWNKRICDPAELIAEIGIDNRDRAGASELHRIFLQQRRMSNFTENFYITTPELVTCTDLKSGLDIYDALLIIGPELPTGCFDGTAIEKTLKDLSSVDAAVIKEGCVARCDSAPGNRLIFSPTGPLDGDYDDVRLYAEAAKKGIKRVLSSGAKSPLLVIEAAPGIQKYFYHELVSILGALEQLYEPMEFRVRYPAMKTNRLSQIGLFSRNAERARRLVDVAEILHNGLLVARDIGSGDPEYMAPPKVSKYINELFQNSCVKIKTFAGTDLLKEFPLFAAVNRAASMIERHKGCVIVLTYDGEKVDDKKKNIYLIGKGITYDTGGADIKAGGIMAGMSRDKCGAAAVAGFFQVLRDFKPKNIRVVGLLCVARNSVGENCYVADEVIESRSGLRIRIGNTDAEGRMVMADPLCWAKEDALKHTNTHLMTIATLTGHACLALGPYSAVIDNGPAKKDRFSYRIQEAGEELGDMMDISSLRREDIKFCKSTGAGEHLLQCNNAASSRTPRGHQFPMAFMMQASGIDKHGSNSEHPLKYTHFDIAGAAGEVPDTPSGVPILALTKFFLAESLRL